MFLSFFSPFFFLWEIPHNFNFGKFHRTISAENFSVLVPCMMLHIRSSWDWFPHGRVLSIEFLMECSWIIAHRSIFLSLQGQTIDLELNISSRPISTYRHRPSSSRHTSLTPNSIPSRPSVVLPPVRTPRLTLCTAFPMPP